MSAAALGRISVFLLICCCISSGQAQQSGSEDTNKHSEKQSSDSPAASKSEDKEQEESAPEAVTIPDPSLSPLEGAWQLLEAGAKSDKTGERAIAIHALGLIRGNTRAEQLAAAAVDDPKPEVRAAAAVALGQMGRKRSIPQLKKLLDDKDNKVVLSAAQALISLQDEDGYQVYYEILTGERKSGGGLIADQEAMLKDPKRLLDLGFHEGLGFVPFGGISWEAYKTITKDDTSPLRAAAAKKLSQDPDPDTTKALISAAGDKNWLVRAAAIESLAMRGDRSTLKTVALYLYDDRAEVKYTAAGAVIRLSGAEPKTAARKNGKSVP